MLSCSIGIAMYPQDADTFVGLYQCADQALYQTKERGKNGYSYFERNDREIAFVQAISYRTRTVIESEAVAGVNQVLAQYFFRMLYRSDKVETVIDHMLEIVGRAYNVSRVYIFENSEDDRFCSNTFEWCNKGIIPEINHLQNLSYTEDLAGVYDYFDVQGVFYCQDIHTLTPNLYECLKNQGIVSVLQCAILEDGVFKGYIGFDECQSYRQWTKEQVESLLLIANVLSTFLLKLRYKERLRRLMATRGIDANKACSVKEGTVHV